MTRRPGFPANDFSETDLPKTAYLPPGNLLDDGAARYLSEAIMVNGIIFKKDRLLTIMYQGLLDMA